MTLLSLILVAAVPAQSPYQVSPLADGTATLAALAVSGLAGLAVKPVLGAEPSCRHRLASGLCDPKDLWSLDREVVGMSSKTWLVVSDIGAGLAFALPALGEAADVWLSGGDAPVAEWGTDVLVIAESVAMATMTTEVLKWGVRRPRPTWYREGAFHGSVEHQLSFPSGHTTSTAAATTAYALTFALRHPDSPWRYAVIAGAVGLTALTGYGRIGGGMHFPSDVIAGALIGAAWGLVIPELHRRGVSVDATVAPTAKGVTAYGASLAWAF